jgi:hypothetical protein
MGPLSLNIGGGLQPPNDFELSLIITATDTVVHPSGVQFDPGDLMGSGRAARFLLAGAFVALAVQSPPVQ